MKKFHLAVVLIGASVCVSGCNPAPSTHSPTPGAVKPPKPAKPVEVGDKAPWFRIQTTEGKDVALTDLRGKVVVVTFFATWCAACNVELPHLQQLWEGNRGNPDFAMIVISRGETKDVVTAFAKDHGYTFPVAVDSDASVFALFAESLIPRAYVISRDGTIRFSAVPGFDPVDFEKLQAELAAQLRSAN
jgi:peroxiredoxin